MQAFPLLLLWAAPAQAQQGVVQQPVVEVVSVDTVVSVPDRGRMLLGSVSAAGSTRSSYGPLEFGDSAGMFRESSSLDVGVFVHDFAAMDAALLRQPTQYAGQRAVEADAEARRASRAGAAWRVLLDEDRAGRGR